MPKVPTNYQSDLDIKRTYVMIDYLATQASFVLKQFSKRICIFSGGEEFQISLQRIHDLKPISFLEETYLVYLNMLLGKLQEKSLRPKMINSLALLMFCFQNKFVPFDNNNLLGFPIQPTGRCQVLHQRLVDYLLSKYHSDCTKSNGL